MSASCARGGLAAKNPLHPRQADLLSEPGASRGVEALLACSPTSMSGSAETGSASPAAGQFCGWKAASIGAHGLLDPVASAGLMFTARAHLRKHRDLLQPPRDCPSPTRCRGRLCDLHSCDWRGECRQRGGHFCRPLAREGGRPTKIPGLGDLLAAEAGKAGDRSAALRARPGGWSWAAPGLSHYPEGGGRRACPGSVSGPAGARHACASVNPE